MPRQSEWIHTLSNIQQTIQSSQDVLCDRNAIEAIFKVSKRQASRILQRMGATRAGGAMVIRGADILVWLENLQKQDFVAAEQARRMRLEERLVAGQREVRARRIQIPMAQDAHLVNLQNIPEIRLDAGELRVRFSTPTELLEKLMLLAQSISDDWPAFEARASGADSRR